MAEPAMTYAELHCLTHFSFQRAASSPTELVQRAWALGYRALAITDECSVAGVVQAWQAWQDLACSIHAERDDALAPLHAARVGAGVHTPLQLIFGSEFRFRDAQEAGQNGTLLALARDLSSWGDLCAWISACRRSAVKKGEYRLPPLADALQALHGCECLWVPCRSSGQPVLPALIGARRIPLLLQLHRDADDAWWLAKLRTLSQDSHCPLLAAGDVRMHVRSAKRLHDVMTAVRCGRPLHRCGFSLQANAEHHLRPLAELAELYPVDTIEATLTVAARCSFKLDEIRYDYPQEAVLPGLTPTQTLRRFTIEGARLRYAGKPRVPIRIWRYVAKELRLIAECRYEMFFLTVYDIVRFANGRGILCQGRGSAANSVVCWCLGITAAHPEHSHPLLERFISKARRGEPPDIDVDFEHERREEVIQYIYGKYGRDRAALAAAVITWRTRSALRDVGMALGIDGRLVDAAAKNHHGFNGAPTEQRMMDLALAMGAPLSTATAQAWAELAAQLRGRPRHLSQHTGGFVLTQTPLTRLVAVEPAAMAGRQIIQWDKDDLEALGLLKVDVLALGMLTAVRRCLDLVSQWRGEPFTRSDIGNEDAATWRMLQRADTVGVFQIESRAQMAMLPRTRPTTFYDLVVQVAIVRPGPITGGMVHPWLQARERKRRGLSIEYERASNEPPSTTPRLAKALERTLGVPIFQEQVMALSMVAAGFSAEKADRLRRAMAAWKKKGGLEPFERDLVGGMTAHGYSADFAQRIFEQIKGFGEYGFPESHAWSFALIAYESAWLKCHEPEAYLAALINSQPMGFYSPSQLIQDAQRHGVTVLPAEASISDWDCTLQPRLCSAGSSAELRRPAVRLGLRLIKGLGQAAVERIVQARRQQPFKNAADLAQRAALDVAAMGALASADALASLAGHRRQQVWQAAVKKPMANLLENAVVDEPGFEWAAAPEGEAIVHDYAAMGLTLRRHPLALLRPHLHRYKPLTATQLQMAPQHGMVRACGIVVGRQRPATAKGTIFVTLEDEAGSVNVIVWQRLYAQEGQRQALLQARLLLVEGQWQRDESGHVGHLVARHLQDLTPLLGRLAESTRSRNFH